MKTITNRKYRFLLFLILLGVPLAQADDLPESWVNEPEDKADRESYRPDPRAPLVTIGEDGQLVYRPFSDRGDKLLDWSYCGYKQSEVPIPDVPVVETLEPLDGEYTRMHDMAYPRGPDSSGQIQQALNRVAAMPPDENGIRGAVLLKRGIYFIIGGLRVRSGVVLRGQGDGPEGTVIIARSRDGGGTAIEVGEPSASIIHTGRSSAVRIEDAYVPTGSVTLTLERAGRFEPGDFVCVRKTVNQQWIDDLGMGERLRHIRGGREGMYKRPWKPGSYQFNHIRQIKAVSGNTITLDVSLPQSIAQEQGGGEFYEVNVDEIATHAGVESLSLVSNYDRSVQDKGKSSNFKNFSSGISVASASDSWVRDCTIMHVSFAGVKVEDDTRQITVRDCKNLRPVGPKRGGKRYAFTVGGGTLHLFYNCFSEDGRHDFVGGSRTMGPYVFLDCTAVRGGQSEPHHRWGSGYLYDNLTTRDGVLAAINRGDSGSGHGWAASNTVFWNCDAKNIVVFDPETEGENNFAIGYTGEASSNHNTRGLIYANTRAGYWGTEREGKYYGYALMGNGYIESPDAPVKPQSLFIRQLVDRIGKEQTFEVLK